MKRSIFWKMVFMVFPFIFLVNAAVLIIAFNISYNEAIEHCEKDVKTASSTAALVFSLYDPDDLTNASNCSEVFSEMCRVNDMAYIDAQKIDLENDTFTYLAIGFGEDATEKAKQTRYAGVELKGVSEDKKKAYTTGESVFHTDNNEFGNMVVCYTPVQGYYDSKSGEFKRDTICIVGAEMSVNELLSNFRSTFLLIAAVVFVTTFLIIALIGFIFRRKVLIPARLISKRMTKFVSDREGSFEPIKFKGHDEFSEMADSFNTMAMDIDSYIEDISKLNSQRSKQEAELNIARNIQMGLLAPASYRSATADIDACMYPARDVGGDLYDYKRLDDGSICVVIADVSGKGVSAALFMSRAITLVNQYAEAGMSPSRILYEFNNHLAEYNPSTMFITTFVGIYNPRTGEFVYSNAGHNDPYLLSDELTALDGAHGMAAGIFKDEKYTESTVTLKPGDTLFLYTDGVTEAKNSNDELFGDEALRAALSDRPDETGGSVMQRVLKRVSEFSENTEQSDDITILTLGIPDKNRQHFCLEAKKENLKEINQGIELLDIPDPDKKQVRLIAEEIFVNICSYAYEGKTGEAEIDIEVKADRVKLVFADSGKPYDPTRNVPDIENYDFDNSIGGFGIFLTVDISENCSYEYKDGKNILTVEKMINNEEE